MARRTFPLIQSTCAITGSDHNLARCWAAGCLLERSRQVVLLGGETVASLRPPLISCEAALSEACFLAYRNGGQPADILQMLRRRAFDVGFDLETEAAAVETLMRRYEDMPMSLADACLVRLSELHSDCRVFTLDRDFTRYRRHARQLIPLLAQW